jgi:hypothetical protein
MLQLPGGILVVCTPVQTLHLIPWTAAGAFRKLMSTEVQQLRQLVAATPQLAPTLQLLDGPIAAAPQQALKAGRAAANRQALHQHQHQQQQQQVLTSAAAESIPAGEDASIGSSSGLGPTAEDLVKDYADAYASMKETMEVRLAAYLTVQLVCCLQVLLMLQIRDSIACTWNSWQ